MKMIFMKQDHTEIWNQRLFSGRENTIYNLPQSECRALIELPLDRKVSNRYVIQGFGVDVIWQAGL